MCGSGPLVATILQALKIVRVYGVLTKLSSFIDFGGCAQFFITIPFSDRYMCCHYGGCDCFFDKCVCIFSHDAR